jgi:hypothetical protein
VLDEPRQRRIKETIEEVIDDLSYLQLGPTNWESSVPYGKEQGSNPRLPRPPTMPDKDWSSDHRSIFPRDAAPAKQAQAFDKTPDRTHAMIVGHQFLQAAGRHSTWRNSLANPLPRGLRGQRFEKLLVLVPSITRVT